MRFNESALLFALAVALFAVLPSCQSESFEETRLVVTENGLRRGNRHLPLEPTREQLRDFFGADR